MQTIKNKILPLLTLLTLLVLGSPDAWAYTWTASVGVDQGKGSAYIEIYNNAAKIFGGQKVVATSKSTTSTALESCNTSVTAASTNGWPICHATADDGYHFAGWYSTSDGKVVNTTDVNYNTYLYLSRNWSRTYYARFAANAYKVKFNANGGTGTMTDQSFTYDAAQNLTANAFTKTGYTFAGWATSADGDVAYSDGQSVSNLTTAKNGTVNLYAKWTANSYKVVFNGNGSTSGNMNDQSFTYDAAAKALTTNAYSRVYTVSYDANGGETAFTTADNTTATYAFNGWEDRNSITYGNTTYLYATFDAPYYANTYGDLYAAFGYNKYSLIQHYIQYGNSEGRSVKGETPGLYPNGASVKNLTTEANGTITLHANWSSASVTLPNATWTNHVIEGWYNGDTKIGNPGDPYTPIANITLTAHWIERYPFTMSGSDRTMEVDDEIENAFTFTYAENPEAHIDIVNISDVHSDNNKVVEYDATHNKLIARNAGKATIYFTQALTETIVNGTSATWTITVNKKNNTLTVAADTYTNKYVEDVISDIVSNINSDAEVTTSSSVDGMSNADAANIAYYDVSKNKILMPNADAASFSSKTVTINIAQAETYKYKPVSKNITLTVNKYQSSFSGSNYSLMVDGTQTVDYSYTSTSAATPTNDNNDDFYYTIDDISYTNQEKNKKYNSLDSLVRFTPSTKEIKALNAGTGKIILHQKETYKYTGATASYNVSVYKYNSTFENVNNFTHKKVGDANIQSNYRLKYERRDGCVGEGNHYQNNVPDSASGNYYYTIGHHVTTDKQAGCPEQYKNVAITYIPSTKTATAWNQGVDTVHLYQNETYKYNGQSASFTVEVEKINNALTCDWGSWSTNLATDDGAFVNFSSDNDITPITVTPATGEDKATYYPAQHAIYTAANLGNATWTVAQAENYKYVAPTPQTLTVNIITVTEGCYVYGPAYPDKEASEVAEITLPKAGSGDVLSFQMKRNQAAGEVAKVTVFDVNGTLLATWYPEAASIWYYDDASTHTYTLPAGTKKIYFQRPGSGLDAFDNPYINNIRITRTEWITLQDAGGNTITSLDKMTNTIGGNSATATFYVDNSVCADSIRVVSNNAHVTVSPASFAPTAERQLITVTYSSATPEEIAATITVYTASQNATLNLTAETEKQTPTLTWGSLYQGEPVSLPVTFTDSLAATASNEAVVTYSVREGEESIISVAAGGRSFTIIGEGTAHLTATSAENQLWQSVSETKEIHTTNKKIQNIVWNQSFTRGLNLGDESALTAEVDVFDLAAHTEGISSERTALIQYTCPAANGVIEKIDATHFRVIGYGETYITASVAGDDDYEAASSVTKLVKVREQQTGECDPALMTEITNEIEFFAFSLGFPEVVHELELDKSKGRPDKLSFYVRGVSYNVAVEYYNGGIDVYESTNGGNDWSEKLASVNPTKNTTAYSDQIQLSPNATHLRFVRKEGGRGYHYVGGINVTAVSELTVPNTTLNLGNIGCGSTYNGHIDLSYYNVKGDLSVAKENSSNGLSIDEIIEAECGTTQTVVVPFSVQAPTEEGAWSNNVTITDELQNKSVEVQLIANITKEDQYIIWNPTLNITGNNPPVLDAYATSGLQVEYEITSGSNARIVNNEVVITSTGTFTITVSQGGNVSYRPAASLSKTFTVEPITLILHSQPVASDITTDQKLGESQLSGGLVKDNSDNVVTGRWEWNISTETSYSEDGVYNPEVIFIPGEHPSWYTNVITTTTLTVVRGQYIYDGSGEWTASNHWNFKEVPTINDDVIINGNVTIPGEANAKSLTINEGSNVTLSVSGQLTIGSGNSKVLDNYGNLHVENGGKVILNEGDLKVKDLVIEAKLGNMNTPANSAEINQADLLNITGDVYFKLTFDPIGHISAGWYDFVVPFEVDVVGGIFLPSNTSKPLTNKVDFAIMEFSEERRAANEKSWTWVSGTLQPGKLYTITLDDEKPERNTYMFKKRRDADIEASSTFSAQCTSNAASTDKGWNGMGNGTLQYRQLNLPEDAKIQVYDHENRCYVQCDAKAYNYAVGTAFFVQVETTKSIDLTTISSNRLFRAPRAEEASTDEFCLALTLEGAENASDHIWVSASDEATGEYVIGRDLVKMGEPNEAKVARIWAKRNNLQLCDAEMPLVYGEANCDLNVFAPADGTYLLEIENGPADAELYLTFNGRVIWDLTSSPASLVLKKGLKEGFGLRMKYNDAPGMAEGVDDINDDTQSMRKVLIDNKIYIITPEGAMYDVNGKLIR